MSKIITTVNEGPTTPRVEIVKSGDGYMANRYHRTGADAGSVHYGKDTDLEQIVEEARIWISGVKVL